MTVGLLAQAVPTYGVYDGEEGLRNSLNNAVNGGGLTYIKHGIYEIEDDILIGTVLGGSGWRITGDPPPANISFPALPQNLSTEIVLDTAYTGKTITFQSVDGMVIDGVSFRFTGVDNEWFFYITSCKNIVFKNCVFINDSGIVKTEPMFKFANVCSDITFENCTFISYELDYEIFNFFQTAGINAMNHLIVEGLYFPDRWYHY